MPAISIVTDGLFDPAKLTAWTSAQQQRIRQGMARAMSEWGKEERDKLRQQAERAFQVRRRSFITSFRYKVFAQRPDQLPALLVGSRLPFAGIFERGGTIRGPMLIPLNQAKHIGPKAFRRIVDSLMRSGNAEFRKVNGKVILFAENIQENSGALARFKRPLRRGLGGGRIKRGADIPIAVLVPQVTIKKRLSVEATIRADLGGLTARIAQRITE